VDPQRDSDSLLPVAEVQQPASSAKPQASDEESDQISPLAKRATRPSSAEFVLSESRQRDGWQSPRDRRHTLDNTPLAHEVAQVHSENEQRPITPDNNRPISPFLRRTHSEDTRRDRMLHFGPQIPRSETRESLLTSAGESEEGGWATPRTGLSPSKSPVAGRRAYSPLAYRSNAARDLYSIVNGSSRSGHRNDSSGSGSASSGGTRGPLNGARGFSPALDKSNVLSSSVISAPVVFLSGDRRRYSGDDKAWFEDSSRRNVSMRTRPGIPPRFMSKREWFDTNRDTESVTGSAIGETSMDEIKNTTKIEVNAVRQTGMKLEFQALKYNPYNAAVSQAHPGQN
jgi:hypothetical protein